MIGELIEAFPCFGPIYQEIMEFAKNPEELIGMLSKELEDRIREEAMYDGLYAVVT